MSVIWTETAFRHLEEIRTYISQYNPQNAQALIGRIVKRVDMLNELMWIGAEIPEYGNTSFREIYEEPYRILYSLADNQAHILAILHSSRKLPCFDKLS